MSTPIRSYSNPSIQRVRAVAAGREPDTLLLEGARLIDDALRGGLRLELLLVAVGQEDRAEAWRAAGLRPLYVEHFLLDRVSRVKHSPGLLALARAPSMRALNELESGTRDAAGRAPLIVVAAGVSDPVNLGALCRSAEAAGAAGLVHVQHGGVHPWNPRAVRGSMGSLFRLPLYTAANRELAVAGLRSAGFHLVRPATRGGLGYREFDWSPATALWIDSETGELDEVSRDFTAVSIPMAGAIDSLNVTVASAVLLFAAGRAEPAPVAGPGADAQS